jgi:hypothetical protein
LRFSAGLTNRGVVNLSFGTNDVFGPVTNEQGGTIIFSGGSQSTLYGAVTNNGELRVSQGGAAVFFGEVSGAGVFSGEGTKFLEGSISPGNSPGAMTFNGNVTLGSAARLTIQIGGPTPGIDYDQLAVTGPTTLGGALEVQLTNGFVPAVGQRFDFLRCDPCNGQFASTQLPALPQGMSFIVAGDVQGLTLLVTGLAGDLNGDMQVDEADLAVFSRYYGRIGTDWTTGDFNDDGRTSLADLAIMQRHFGEDLQILATTMVPEPSALLSVVLGLILCAATASRVWTRRVIE